MDGYLKRKQDKFERQIAFVKAEAADFPATSSVGKKCAAMVAEVDEMKRLAAQQLSGTDDSRMHYDDKDDALDELYALLKKITRAANAMTDKIPNLESKFRLPRNRSQQNLLIAGRSFYNDSEGYEEQFVEDYYLPAEFRAGLLDLVNEIESSKSAADAAGTNRSEATGGMIAACRRASIISDQLDSAVKNKYADNPAKLAAWRTASHLDRAPKRNDSGNSNNPPVTE